MNHYEHWRVAVDAQQVMWLGLDRADSAVNTLHHAILDELNSLLQDIEEHANLRGVVIYSAKEKGFIAGADVHLFSAFTTSEAAQEFLRKGQVVFSRLEMLSVPTIALIHGFCMGGGLELALACDYRIVTDAPDTKLGLPEVLLGIHPGWGGTVRLPLLIGGFAALSKVILTGKALSAKAAKQLGMVDEVVPLRQLKRAALDYIQRRPAKHRPGWLAALTNQAWLRPMLAALMRSQLTKKIQPNHYPAPFAALTLWEKESGAAERAYLQEIESVEKLVSSNSTAKNLIRAFLLRERMKSFAKTAEEKVARVHVVGAGTMGGDIAAWCALSGLRVTVQDQQITSLAPMMARAGALFQKVLKSPRLVQAAMDRLIPDIAGEGMARADVIIEAIFENLNVKRALFKEIEARAKPEALIATNTSSIPLEEIAEVLKNPERLVGIHFFNPVSKMELVEIVRGNKTTEAICQRACSFVAQIKKLPLPVKSSPGFLVNRVLMPYLMAAVSLLEEGHAAEQIDASAKHFGMMMGPVELADTVGLDVCLAVAENLVSHFGGHVPTILRDKVKQKHLGRKTGQGFYAYKKGKPVKKAVDISDETDHLIKCLMDPLVQEANACLHEQVVADADLLDAGMIFATGFAPFRGGPMQWASGRGGAESKAQS